MGLLGSIECTAHRMMEETNELDYLYCRACRRDWLSTFVFRPTLISTAALAAWVFYNRLRRGRLSPVAEALDPIGDTCPEAPTDR
jgi:hypothetical protein